ncbi:MAG: hypothetical protein ABIU63_09105 [Chitinophagaceae bacterium]
MKVNIKKSVFILILLVAVMKMLAQDEVPDVIKKIYNSYNQPVTIYFTGKIQMYDKAFPEKIIDRAECRYTMTNNSFNGSIGPVSILLNDRYYVSADNGSKILVIGRRKDLPKMSGTPVSYLEQLSNGIAGGEYTAIASHSTNAGLLELKQVRRKDGATAFAITYNILTGYMEKVMVENTNYDNGSGKTMVLEITYSKPIKLIAGSGFSEKVFFSIVHNKLEVNNAYKDYQLINQL